MTNLEEFDLRDAVAEAITAAWNLSHTVDDLNGHFADAALSVLRSEDFRNWACGHSRLVLREMVEQTDSDYLSLQISGDWLNALFGPEK